MKPLRLFGFFLSTLVTGITVLAADSPPKQLKAAQIILPKITFNKAPVAIAVRFLNAKSRELDPEKTGVAIALTGHEDRQTRVSLDMTNISVVDATKKLAEAANLEMRMNGETIVLKTKLTAPSTADTPHNAGASTIPGLDPIPK